MDKVETPADLMLRAEQVTSKEEAQDVLDKLRLQRDITSHMYILHLENPKTTDKRMLNELNDEVEAMDYAISLLSGKIEEFNNFQMM